MLIDSHCHLNYLDDSAAALIAARERGVGACLCIAVDEAGWPDVQALAEAHSDVFATAGIHPDAAVPIQEAERWLPAAARHPRVVAIGETGLDYSRNPNPEQIALQRASFDWQLQLAAERDLPVVVHTRDAASDTLEIMRGAPDVIGVMHCFTETWEMARAALDMGYYISMSGIVTFKNAAQVQEVARQVPADRLLVETDAPWLAPVPFRGKPNQPAYVAETAAFVAQLRGVATEELIECTTQNVLRLFQGVTLPQVSG